MRRGLGRAFLSVKPEQVGIWNATKPENLGVIEYAYLDSPLPKDLKGSEIHSLAQSSARYFLMVRIILAYRTKLYHTRLLTLVY